MTKEGNSLRGVVMMMVGLAAFAWALVNSVDAVASAMVLLRREGYRPAIFTVADVEYRPSRRRGLVWGLAGSVEGRAERLFDPTLASERTPGLGSLRRSFPIGTRMKVWYNPQATGALVQRRSLRVLPYAEDLAGAQMARLAWWGKYCLLPLIAVFLLAGRVQ